MRKADRCKVIQAQERRNELNSTIGAIVNTRLTVLALDNPKPLGKLAKELENTPSTGIE
jgi:hypothetical protein